MRDKWPCLLQTLQSLAMEFLSLYKENTRSMDCDEKHNEQYMVRRNIPFMKSICTSLWHESKYYSSELFCGFIFSCVDKSCWCAQIGGFRPMFQWQYAYNVSQLFSVCLGMDWILALPCDRYYVVVKLKSQCGNATPDAMTPLLSAFLKYCWYPMWYHSSAMSHIQRGSAGIQLFHTKR